MKNKLGKLLCLILSAVCIGCSVGCNGCKPDPNTLYVYTSAGFPPYEYVNGKGEVVGVDIDLMRLVGDKIGYKVRFYDIEFKSIFIKVQKYKNAIGAAGITVNEEREKSGLFSIHYSTSEQYVIVKKDAVNESIDLVNGKLPKSWLAKKNIGVQLSTTGNYLIDGLVKGDLSGSGAACLEYKNVLTAYGSIGSRLDCFVIDKLPAIKVSDITKGTKNELKCYPLDEAPESYALYLNKGATELKQKIDVALQELINEGEVARLIEKHSL